MVEEGISGWERLGDYPRLIAERMAQPEGEPAAVRRVFPSLREAWQEVRRLARQAGAGLAAPVRLRHYHQVSGHREDLPNAVVLAMAMRREAIRTAPSEAASLEVFRVYYELGETAARLAASIRDLGWRARAHHPLSDFGKQRTRLLFVPMAVDAGIAELGRCGFAITPRLGNMVRLAAVTTDLPLPAGRRRRAGIEEFCSLCTLCQRACPAGAIAGERRLVHGVWKWPLDAEACFRPFQDAYGCAVCMAVCPYGDPVARARLVRLGRRHRFAEGVRVARERGLLAAAPAA